MATDEKVLQQWDDYYSEYGSNLAEQESEINDRLNSNSYSNEQKAKMAHDLEMQKEYYRQLGQNKTYINDYYQQHGELPATVNFNVKGSGLIYQSTGSTGDGKIHSVRQIAGGYISSSDSTYNYYCVAESDQMKLIVKTSKDSSIVTKGSFSDDVNDYHYTGTSLESTSNTWRDAWYYDQKGYLTGTTNQMFQRDNNKFYFGTRADTDTTHNPPAISRMSIDNLLRGSTSTTLPVSVNIGVGQEYDEGDEDVPTDAPWDYFNDMNDDLDPDNSVFPEGYSPTPEDQPPDEPQDLPHDDGTTLPNQTDRILGAANRFITQYILNADKLDKFGKTLWTSWNTPSDANNLVKNFLYDMSTLYNTGTFDISRVFEYVISLKAFPFDLTSLTQDYLGANDGIYMGTGLTNLCPGYESIPYLNTIIGALYAGTCTIVPDEPYQDFRDMYNTTVSIFLPYCGIVELSPAEVINRDISVWYFIDFQSGGCTAVVVLDGDAGEYNIAAKSGQMGFTLPITATNAGQIASTLVGDATNGISTVANTVFNITGKAMGMAQSAAMSGIGGGANSEAAQIQQEKAQVRNEYAQREGAIGIFQSGFNGVLGLANGFNDMLSRSAVDIPFMSGGSGSESMMFAKKPYVQIRRGKYCKPDNYPHSVGHINGSSGTISSFKGKFAGQPDTGSSTDKGLCFFTGVDSSGLTCHDDERAEIIALLESGVYL